MACELKNLTDNPVCSKSLQDLENNTIIMDQYINSPEHEVNDRLGVMRITWAGLEFKVNNAIDNAVGAIRLEWQTGLTNIGNSTTQSLTEINQAKQDAIDEILEVGGVNVVQTTGQSEEDVMSQKAVSDEIDRINGELTTLQNNIDNIPVDQVFTFTGVIPPTGYVDLKGQLIDEEVMPKLFERYGTHLPDSRDRVLRMYGELAGNIGTTQEDAIRNITGRIGSATYQTTGTASGVFANIGNATLTAGSHDYSANSGFDFDASRIVPTAEENRVKALIVTFCHKIQ